MNSNLNNIFYLIKLNKRFEHKTEFPCSS
jgi:hypothetical protein